MTITSDIIKPGEIYTTSRLGPVRPIHCLKADSVKVTWNNTLALRNKSWVRRELGIRAFGGLYND